MSIFLLNILQMILREVLISFSSLQKSILTQAADFQQHKKSQNETAVTQQANGLFALNV